MKVNGISLNKILNIYEKSKKEYETTRVSGQKDSIEISSLGKSLSSYVKGDETINSKEKVENIKKAVENGTYNVDKKLVAAKIIEAMKGKL
ncbi:flagellar biosynthesis anti-sigma factor FlgM [Clostridium kluyveri]|uniref:Negative regulator of flagellin synthesis n=1 Tax=Clostridium kluyveri TaxID=1534 RepID=A0A1L5F8E9_CLOKL|nr:flagellar biosynthesis anti-sigma factor FlgM [Clostridium kluyveri]APM39306.1 flagellar biosynthesis anti-sigma factor FlgM [Clostridium kluyveri]